MNAALDKISEADIGSIRSELTSIIESRKLTLRGTAASIGVPEGTLGPFRSGKYAGDNLRVAQQVKIWLDAQHDMIARAEELVQSPVFQRTPTSKKIETVLEYAQFGGDIALIGCGPGTGKTETIHKYAASRPRVTIATMTYSSRGVNTALATILEALKDKTSGSPLTLNRRICEHFKEPGGLLIVDECQFLQPPAIDEARSIHDRTGTGIAFVGDMRIFKLFDEARDGHFGQLQSRIGLRMKQKGPTVADVELMAAAWDVRAPREIDFLQRVARRQGGLRHIDKLMKQATRYARMEGEARGERHLHEVWETLSAGAEL